MKPNFKATSQHVSRKYVYSPSDRFMEQAAALVSTRLNFLFLNGKWEAVLLVLVLALSFVTNPDGDCH